MIINDITGLNPTAVANSLAPRSLTELQQIIKTHEGFFSIGGGRYSMGGQTAAENSLHIDMRLLNRVIEFRPAERVIRVQAGMRWRELQAIIDPHGLAVAIMQSYANFTIGGSLSVNAHGRYIGLGPLVLSVQAIGLLLGDGSLIQASPKQNSELFYGAIGGYGGLGIITEAVLNLVLNTKIECQQLKLRSQEYPAYFAKMIRNSSSAVLHNADLYPPRYTKVRAVTWYATDKSLTKQQKLVQNKKFYVLNNYFLWAVSEMPLGKWRREFILDPMLYCRKQVVWRNYEASHEVAELEPLSRKHSTYVLQEYFIPIAHYAEFVPKLAEVLQRYAVNVLNISVRHAIKDPGTVLAWAREEVFSFVLYYKHYLNEAEQHKVAIWTRELIDAALSLNGSYYLPYQLCATIAQFKQAYPQAEQFYKLKQRWDPEYKFRSKFWDKYYSPSASQEPVNANRNSDFKRVFAETFWQDKFYLFLQNVYNIYPEHKFHLLLSKTCKLQETDETIYAKVQAQLPSIKPFLAELRYAIPALLRQKREITRQTMSLLEHHKSIVGYMEIGTTGRYLSHLAKKLQIKGPVYLLNDKPPSNSPVDIVERGRLRKLGQFVPLNDYAPLTGELIQDQSLDLVTCYIGLHHCPLARLDEFVNSIARVLRPGGKFLLREHDVKDEAMRTFVCLVHTVFNLGLGISWQENCQELRHFTSIEAIVAYLESRGFKHTGQGLLQAHDPSANTLLEFVKL